MSLQALNRLDPCKNIFKRRAERFLHPALSNPDSAPT
jgi:hypothetical protein